MKRVVLEVDVETGQIQVSAKGFQGKTCDGVLEDVVKDFELAKTTYEEVHLEKTTQRQEIELI